ncbi:MAG: L,D-transpeptidase family protein [Ignavibacteria bacterium]|nr:L,D-transpeptidase family protein [Ignavibacteria bacterium]
MNKYVNQGKFAYIFINKLRKNSYILILYFIILCLQCQIIVSQAQRSTKSGEKNYETSSKGNVPKGFQRISFPIENPSDADEEIKEYMQELFPIIDDFEIKAIQGSKEITKKLVNDTLGHVEFLLNFNVPEHYLDPEPVALWELNIPEFTSRIYQIYKEDTILITVWPNVVGAPATKTYTGYYNIFRIRNWPSWKDPEAPAEAPATPPGPGNPLGLFAAHYDENSLRYFHGTNKNHLLKNEYRALSHGCVRNDNANIDKMKRFIVTKIVTSRDLSGWVNSKKSMTYDFTEDEKKRFPVRIIYKTFNIDRDLNGAYIIFFKDVYGYEKDAKISKFDNQELITLSVLESIVSEYKAEHKPHQFQLPDDKLIPIVKKLISSRKYNQKYYFDELAKELTETGK